MWSNVISPTSPRTLFATSTTGSPDDEIDGGSGESDRGGGGGGDPPPTRYKHATTLHYSRTDGKYYLYVYGGRSGTFALKDFWELDLSTGVWREIKPPDAIATTSSSSTVTTSCSSSSTDSWPPRLQEHTLVSANNRLYVFGGECHHNSDTSSHLWVWQREHEQRGWEKIRFKQDSIGVGVNSNGNSGGGSSGGSSANAYKRVLLTQQCAPVMRRGHSAVVADVEGLQSVVVYGGYRDLKGSQADCWAYAAATNTWTLLSQPPSTSSSSSSNSSSSASSSSSKPGLWTSILSYWTNSSHERNSTSSYTNLNANGYCKHTYEDSGSGPGNSGGGGGGGAGGNSHPGPIPPARHNHSAVHYNGRMFVYGGMSDLNELADFWALDLDSRRWSQIRCLHNPGCLKGHAATVVGSSMYIFGGESKGVRVDDVWRFDFSSETFECLQFPSCHPCPRVFATSVKLPIRKRPPQQQQPQQPSKKLQQQEKPPQCQDEPSPTPPLLVDTSSSSSESQQYYQSNNSTFGNQDSAPTRPSTFRKSTSVVRFADNLVTYDGIGTSATTSPTAPIHTPSCSDYSSMETINYVENPVYRKFESFELKPIGWGGAPGDRSVVVADDHLVNTFNRLTTVTTPRNTQHAEYVLLIGGLETHKSTVFTKSNLVLWRLRIECFCNQSNEAEEIEENEMMMMMRGSGTADGNEGSGGGGGVRGKNGERSVGSFEVEF